MFQVLNCLFYKLCKDVTVSRVVTLGQELIEFESFLEKSFLQARHLYHV